MASCGVLQQLQKIFLHLSTTKINSMSPVSSLLNLYPSILSPVYSEWLDAKGLCRLDSAVCSTTLRRPFLANLQLSSQDHLDEINYVSWVNHRSIRLRSFESDAMGLAECEKIALARISSLDSLIVKNVDLLKEVLKLCPVVRSVKFDFAITDAALAELLPTIKGLLYVSFSKMVSKKIIALIADLFPSLKGIEADADVSLLAERCKSLEVVDARFNAMTITSLSESMCIRSLCLKSGSFKSPTITDESMMPLLCGGASLTKLSLGLNELTDAFGVLLAEKCPQLTHLCLSKTTVSDATLTSLSQHCPLLQHLEVSSDAVTDTGILAVVQGCPMLTSLNVSHCNRVTDVAVTAVLSSCKRLTALTASHVGASDDAYVNALTSCPTLELLVMDNLTNKGSSRAILSMLCDLESIDIGLGQCTLRRYMADPGIFIVFDESEPFSFGDYQSILSHCPRLRRMFVNRQDFTNDSVDLLLARCPLVREVALSFTSVDFTAIASVIAAYPLLEYLEVLSKDPDEGGEYPPLFVSPMVAMRFLRFHSCYGITDAVMEQIMINCPNLTSLQLSDTHNVSKECFQRLIKTCVKLTSISVVYCASIGGGLLEFIIENGRPMKEVHLSNVKIHKKDRERLVPLLGALVKKIVLENC